MLVYALVINKGAILMCQPTFGGSEQWSWELPYTSIFPPQDNTTEDTARKVLQEKTGLSLPVGALVGYCESYCESYKTENFVKSYDSYFFYLMDSSALADEIELVSPVGSSSRIRWVHCNQIDDESIKIGDFSRLIAKRVLEQNLKMLYKREEYRSEYWNDNLTGPGRMVLYQRPYTYFM